MKTSMIRTLAIFVCLFTLAAAAFAAEPQLLKKEPAQAPPPDYVVGPEDILDISVWKNADLSRVVVVRPDGMISLPL
ncbi:MAG TPA: polysaccharide biosynthesis/export family protein, partial [Syntrophales bacterium]|nr:polysaccharide biosynthesis/export family protein [Syntrophales bacterium]